MDRRGVCRRTFPSLREHARFFLHRLFVGAGVERHTSSSRDATSPSREIAKATLARRGAGGLRSLHRLGRTRLPERVDALPCQRAYFPLSCAGTAGPPSLCNSDPSRPRRCPRTRIPALASPVSRVDTSVPSGHRVSMTALSEPGGAGYRWPLRAAVMGCGTGATADFRSGVSAQWPAPDLPRLVDSRRCDRLDDGRQRRFVLEPRPLCVAPRGGVWLVARAGVVGLLSRLRRGRSFRAGDRSHHRYTRRTALDRVRVDRNGALVPVDRDDGQPLAVVHLHVGERVLPPVHVLHPLPVADLTLVRPPPRRGAGLLWQRLFAGRTAALAGDGAGDRQRWLAGRVRLLRRGGRRRLRASRPLRRAQCPGGRRGGGGW